ncbi:MAG: FAD-dependent oxidoreductase [cyanobacterium endosymbiont of Rhopalodia sterrenbergii]
MPDFHWISRQIPLEVLRQDNRVTRVRLADYCIDIQITLDSTQLGNILALAEVPYRWGWEWQLEFNEPSAPIIANELTKRYSGQALTWMFILRDYEDFVFSIPPSAFSSTFQRT